MKFKIVKVGENKTLKYNFYVVFNGFDLSASFKIGKDGVLFGLKLYCECFAESEMLKEAIYKFISDNK